MPNNQDADVTSSSGPVVDVTDDVHDRFDDVVSLDGGIESSISLESIDNSGDSDVHPALDSASHTSKEIPIAARNSKFFIEDELCRFQVGEQYFQVHSHMFIVQSEKARDLLSPRLHHPERLVVLEDVAPAEFEKFLTAVYCNVADEPELSTKEDWTAVLKLSCLFDFASLRTFAIAKLFPITNAVDKIVLARKYGIDEWLEDAYFHVSMAPELPSDEDSEALGFSTFRKIARVREILDIRQSTFSREQTADDHHVILNAFFGDKRTEHNTGTSTHNTSPGADHTPTPCGGEGRYIPNRSENPVLADAQEAERMARSAALRTLEEARCLREAAELKELEHQQLAAEAEATCLAELEQKRLREKLCLELRRRMTDLDGRLNETMRQVNDDSLRHAEERQALEAKLQGLIKLYNSHNASLRRQTKEVESERIIRQERKKHPRTVMPPTEEKQRKEEVELTTPLPKPQPKVVGSRIT